MKKVFTNKSDHINLSASLVSKSILDYFDRKLERTLPIWIDNYELNQKKNPAQITLTLNKEPERGAIQIFQNKLIEMYGGELKFKYRANNFLKAEKQKHKSIKQRSFFKSKIEENLPPEFELINFWIIGIPLEKGSYKFLLCKISCNDRDNPRLEKWKRKFEDENEIQILIRHDWSKKALKKTLNKLTNGAKIIDKSHTKILEKISMQLLGNKYNDRAKLLRQDWVNTKYLKDYTGKAYPWVTSDDVGVKDKEDMFYAKMNTNGEIEFSIAISETSQIIDPKSIYLKRARKLFANIYYRNHVTHILPKNISHYFASFIIDKPTRAMVMTYTLNSEGTKLLIEPEVSWGLVKSRGNIPPELLEECLNEKLDLSFFTKKTSDPKEYDENKEAITRSIKLMDQILPFFKRKIKIGKEFNPKKPIMSRFKDTGIGSRLVSTAMINFYSDMAEFCLKNNIPFIAKNQSYPDQNFIDEISEKIRNTGTTVSDEDFKDGFKLFGLIDYLNRVGFYHLADVLIDKFLLKTTYSETSRGFAAFSNLPYIDCKARTFPGLINAMNIVAFLSKVKIPFTHKDIEREAKNSNIGKKSHSEFRFLGSALRALSNKIKLTGEVFLGSLYKKSEQDKTFVKVPGFYQESVLANNYNNEENNLNLTNDTENIPLLFEGFDYEEESYVFSKCS